MADAISNTSPLLYLYRIGAIAWLADLFGEVWTPNAVDSELKEGRRKGHDVPTLQNYEWLMLVDPRVTPSEWLSLDLGKGELAAMALALENPTRFILLDDGLARRTGSITCGRLSRAPRQTGGYDCVEPRAHGSGQWMAGLIDSLSKQFVRKPKIVASQKRHSSAKLACKRFDIERDHGHCIHERLNGIESANFTTVRTFSRA